MTMLDGTYDGGGDGYETDFYDNDFLGDHGSDASDSDDEGEDMVSEYGDYSNDADDFEGHQLALDGDDY